MTSALIDQPAADVPRAVRGSASVLVLEPEARAAYDTTQMAYSLRPHHIAYFSRNQWGERPAQMLQPLLVRSLEATGAFGAILTPPLATGAASHELRTELLDLVQDFGTDPPLLRLSLRVQLQALEGRHTVATREFSVRETMHDKSPQAGVAAANAATAQVLRDIAAFVLEQTRLEQAR
jgi:cholesterol transport system auxiliary component